MAEAADVIIIGAGVVGTALAHELARRGASVTVLERDSPGRRATWAAAGMLSPFSEAGTSPELVAWAEQSLDRYAAFVHVLREETGIDVEYRTNGRIQVAFDQQEATALEALADAPLAARLEARLLGPDEVHELEPELADGVIRALLVGRDHRVNNRLLAQALAAAAIRAGATIRTGTPSAGIVAAGGRVTGVRLTSNQTLPARQVVIAAGAWSGDIEGLPRPLPVFPVKSQMLAIDGRGRHNGRSGRAPIERVLFGRGAFLIPERMAAFWPAPHWKRWASGPDPRRAAWAGSLSELPR